MNVKQLFFGITCILTLTCNAQPFQPDAYGYVSDPAFLELIKSRKYRIVGTYDSIAEMPGVFAALAYKDSATLVLLDINGKELSVPEEKNPYDGSYNEPRKIKRDEKKNDTPSLEIFQKNDRLGVRDLQRKEILPPKFDSIVVNKHNDSILLCKQSGKWGIYTVKGEEIKAPFTDKIIPLNKSIDFPTTAYTFHVYGKWGLLSDKGVVISEAVYKYIRENPETPDVLTLVADGKVGFMHRSGTIIHEPFYQGVFYLPEYAAYGIVSFKKPDGSKSLLSIRTGQELNYRISQQIKKGTLYKVTGNQGAKNNYGIMDLATQKVILPIEYGEIIPTAGTNLIVQKYGENGKTLSGACDTNGTILIPVMYEKLDGDFYNGWSVCSKNGQFGVINLKNEPIVPLKYENLRVIYIQKSNQYSKLDYLIVTKEGKQGIISLKEQVIVQPVYSNIRPANSGLMVTQYRQNGVISFDGKELIPLNYDSMNDGPKPGIFKGVKAGKYYLLDFYGNSMEFTLKYN
ncbi:MAG: WG repeat-containing protein [Bacteroidota bacterium]